MQTRTEKLKKEKENKFHGKNVKDVSYKGATEKIRKSDKKNFLP